MNKKEYCIGIDIGGSHIKMAIFDYENLNNKDVYENKIIEFEEVYFNKEDKKDQNTVINFIETNIQNMKKSLSNKIGLDFSENINFVGVACPGIIQNGVIKNAENLNIDEYNILEFLKSIFNAKDIVVINDGLAGIYGEKEFGNLKDAKDALFLTIGTGIGGEAILNGEVVKTSTNIGFEFGHIIIELNGKKCSCGKNGCFEQYGSMRTLRKYINEVLNESAHLDLNQILNEEYLNKNEKENIRIKESLDRYIYDLANGIVSLCEIFNPQIICVSGSFSKYDYLFKSLQEELKKRPTVTENRAVIKPGLLKNDANIYGAVIYGKVRNV